jgi:DNA-damage-inducible protein J
MAQTNINIRIDSGLKKQAEALFKEMGMNMSTAFNIFARQAVRQRKIPFEVSVETTEEDDPFYSESNMKVLKESIRQLEKGGGTEHELIEA